MMHYKQIISKFYQIEIANPFGWFSKIVCSKHVFNDLIELFGLTICLKAICDTKRNLSTCGFKDCFPKVLCKLGISIRNDSLGKTMIKKNSFHKDMSNVFC